MEKFRKFPKIPESAPRVRLYEFGPFCLNPQKRIVLRAKEPLALTPKCFEILQVLVEHHDEVLIKEELMKSVWQDTIVEEGNLNRHISTLRKALGESPNDHHYIVTVPGRGYRFVAEVREVSDVQPTVIRHDERGGSNDVECTPESLVRKGALQSIPVHAPVILRPAASEAGRTLSKRYLWSAGHQRHEPRRAAGSIRRLGGVRCRGLRKIHFPCGRGLFLQVHGHGEERQQPGLPPIL